LPTNGTFCPTNGRERAAGIGKKLEGERRRAAGEQAREEAGEVAGDRGESVVRDGARRHRPARGSAGGRR